MTLPSTLKNTPEWTFVGPLGPKLPKYLLEYPILAVDGGANFLTQMDVWVGDSDSFAEEALSSVTLKYPPEKDQSDLSLALGLFTEPMAYRFHLWGFLGGRRDHELFNLGEALRQLEQLPKSKIIFYDHIGLERFHLYAAGNWTLNHNGIFSVGSLKEYNISLKGKCRYTIPTPRLLQPLSSFGLSNEAFGEMTMVNDGPVFIYYPEQA